MGQGHKDQLVPENEFDTSVGNRGKVFVKFYDNEMLPLYVVFYHESTIGKVHRPKFSKPLRENFSAISEVEKNKLAITKVHRPKLINHKHENFSQTTVIQKKISNSPQSSKSSCTQTSSFNALRSEYQSSYRETKPKPILQSTTLNELPKNVGDKRPDFGQNTSYIYPQYPSQNKNDVQNCVVKRSPTLRVKRPPPLRELADYSPTIFDEISVVTPQTSQQIFNPNTHANMCRITQTQDPKRNQKSNDTKSRKSCGFKSCWKSLTKLLCCCCFDVFSH